MKLQALCIITFLSFLTVIKSDQPNPSFLRFVGSYKYNTTDDGKITLKRYYMSQRIKYTWIDSFLSCKSVGMRLALIETDDEGNNLAAMARRNNKLFQNKVFVDGYNLTVSVPENDYFDEKTEPEPCYSIQKESKSKLRVRNEKCNNEYNKFLCEYVEVVDSYDDPQLSDKPIDVKATFFTYIGDFDTKKYYASFKLKAWGNNVPKICQSFGMEMVSPQNQAEYDNLRHLLQEFHNDWDSVSIAGYRSEENDNEWVVHNNKVNYQIEWIHGQPNNIGKGEDCIALKNMVMGVPKMFDVMCQAHHQFLCQFDESRNEVKMFDPIEQSKLLKPLTSYEIGSLEKELFVSLYDVDWTTAILTCKSFGMELLTPYSVAEDKIMRTTLEKVSNLSTILHVGVTSMGTNDVWYSIKSGNILDYDFEWSPQTSYSSSSSYSSSGSSSYSLSRSYSSSSSYSPNSNCLRLRKCYEKFSYEAISCINTDSHFICEKVMDTTEDIQKITSTSIASWITSTTPLTAISIPNEILRI